MNFFDRGNGQSDSDQTADIVWDSDNAKVALPATFNIATVQFERLGPDLKIISAEGETILVTNYFANLFPHEIILPNGVVLPADIVTKLAGPIAPKQYAQEGGVAGAEPIGTVETAEGAVTVIRADGTRVSLATGDPVYQGDELITDAGAAVGIIFADETTFALGEEGRMILDEMVYDPGGEDGSIGLTLLTGAMTFVSGSVAKVNPDAMSITTPVATIGIRGTGGILKTDGADTQAALVGEADGLVGEISVTAPNGDTITINVANGFVTASANGLSDVVIGTTADMMALGGNGLIIMAQAGLLSDEISQAAEEQSSDREPDIELNSTNDVGIDFSGFLVSFQNASKTTSDKIFSFLREIGVNVEPVIKKILEEENEYDAAGDLLETGNTTANSASEAASAAEQEITDILEATYTDSDGNELTYSSYVQSELSSTTGVSESSDVYDVLTAGYNSFGAALSISSAASSIANLATAGFYTTGEDDAPSGAELEIIAAEIQAASTAVLEAANNVATVVDAVIYTVSTIFSELQDTSVQTTIQARIDHVDYPDYSGVSYDDAVMLYIADRDNELMNEQLAASGIEIPDGGSDYLDAIPTFLDDVLAAIDSAIAAITDLQTEKGDAAFLSDFVDVLNAVKTFVQTADDTTQTAYEAMQSTTPSDVSTKADEAKTAGLAAEDDLETLKTDTISGYTDPLASNIVARLASAASSAELRNTTVETNNATITATFKATIESGEAGKDYLDQVSQDNLFGTDLVTDINGAGAFTGVDADEGSEGTVFAARDEYATAKTGLTDAIDDLETATAEVLSQLPDWATAKAKKIVLEEKLGEALDNVQTYALEEVETNLETMVDTLFVGFGKLVDTIASAASGIVGDAPADFTTASDAADTIYTDLTTLKDTVDGWGLFDGTSEPTAEEFDAAIESLKAINTKMLALVAQVDAGAASLDSFPTSKALMTGVSTAVDDINTDMADAVTAYDAITFEAVLNATTYADSVTDINTAIGHTTTAINGIVEALQDFADSQPSNTFLSDNAASTDQTGADGIVLNGYAKDLTDLWEAAYDTVNSDLTDATNAFTPLDTDYQAAKDDEQDAKDDLTGDPAVSGDRGALGTFKTEASEQFTAEKTYAYDKAYLNVGEAMAKSQAELFLRSQERAAETAIQDAIQAAEDAAAAYDKAKLAGQIGSEDPVTTNEAVAEATAAQAAVDLALTKVTTALTNANKLNPANDDLATTHADYYKLAFASPADWADRVAGITAISDAVTQLKNGSVAQLLNIVVEFDKQANGDGSADPTTAETALVGVQLQEADDRSARAVQDASNADAKVTAVLDLANAAKASVSGEGAIETSVTALYDALVTKSNGINVYLTNVTDARTDVQNELPAGDPDVALGAAKIAETNAQSARQLAISLDQDSRAISAQIVHWAIAEITVQLGLALAAKDEALAADTEATRLSALIKDDYDFDTVTDEAVQEVTDYSDLIAAQFAISNAKNTAAKDAADRADALLDIAKAAANVYSEFGIQLQKAADEVGVAREYASEADNADSNLNSTNSSADLSKQVVSATNAAKTQIEAAEKAAEDAADAAQAQAEADALAAAEAQALADQVAEDTASALATTAQEKAALAEAAAEAAQEAAVNANSTTASAQYDLALQYSQEAAAAASAAADAAAGHGADALAFATEAAGYASDAQASLAVANVAKLTAENSAGAADSWRDGSATTNTEETAEAVTDVTRADNDLVALANANATAAIAAVNVVKYGSADRTGSIDLRIAAEAAKGAWESQKISENEAIERLVTEMTNRGNQTVYSVADIEALADADPNELDTITINPVDNADLLILNVWLNALKTATAAKENAEEAYETADDAATAAEGELAVAESEAGSALQAAVDAAAQVADLVAKAAAAVATETLGRLAADLQAESTVDDVLDVMTTSANAVESSTSSNDAGDVIDAQSDTLDTLAAIAGANLSADDLTDAQAAYDAAASALATALTAKNNAEIALLKITTDFDADDSNGEVPAIEQFYVDVTGLPGTPTIGTLDSYTVDHDWVYVNAAETHVIHVDSIAKYQSVLSNIDLAEKQAAQITTIYNGLVAKVDEAAQTLSQIESAYDEANFAAVSEINDKFDEYVEKAETATEKAVDSSDAALSSAKNAIEKVVALAGGEIDGSNVVTINSVQHDQLTNGYQKIVSALALTATLVTTVDGWSQDGNDPDDTAEIDQLISDIDTILADLGDVVTELEGNVTTNTYAEQAAVYADAAATEAKAALTAAKDAATNLLDISDNSIDLGGTIEDALAQLVPANDAVTNAQTAAQKSQAAASNDQAIAQIQETQSQDAADAAAEAARQADLDAVIAARDSVSGVSTDARADATAAKAAYDAAVVDYNNAKADADAAKALVDALDGSRDYVDLETKSALEQASTAAQNALGDAGSTPDTINVVSEVAKAKAAWLEAETNADAAETAYAAIQQAVTDATSAFNAGNSVSQYRQTAETNAKTVEDKNAAADKNRETAETAETDAGTAADRVVEQAEIAVEKNDILTVSETVADYKTTISESINGDDADTDGALSDLEDLKAARDNAIAQGQIASTKVDDAVTDMENNPAADPTTQLADELADAEAARDLALQHRGTSGVDGVDPNAAEELDELNAAYDSAEAAVIAARAAVSAAGSNANDVAQEQLAKAETLFTKITGLKAEAETAYAEADAAYQEAVNSVTAIEQFISAEITAAEARQQAIDAVESEADQSYETALQTSTRAQTISDEISDGSTGVYDLANSLATSLKTQLTEWLAAESTNDNYETSVEDAISDLLDRIDDDSDDLVVQLNDAKDNVDSAYDAIFNAGTGHLKLAQDAANVTPADLTEAQTAATEASDQAQNVENQTAQIEAQRSLFDGLYNDIQSVEESFNQIIAEADAENALAQAEAEAAATPFAYNDEVSVNEDAFIIIDLFADNGNGADKRSVDNDADLDNDFELIAVSQPANGTVEILETGDAGYDVNKPGQVKYTPDPDYTGPDTFSYTMSNGGKDGDGNDIGSVKFSSADVTVTVDPLNDAPIAVDDFAFVGDEVSAVDVRVLLNDTDIDGDTVSIHGVIGDGTDNTVETDNSVNVERLNPDGSPTGEVIGTATWTTGSSLITFTPAAGSFDHLDEGDTESFTFSYQVTDGSLNSASAEITVTMTGTNDAPEIAYTPTTTTFTEALDDSIASVNVFNTSGFTIGDPDGDPIQSATVKITNFNASEDLLTFTSQNGVDGTFNASTGVLTLTDTGTSATDADFKAVIESVQYSNTSQDPDTTGRDVSLVINDGSLSSTSVTQTVDVVANNDAPIVSDAMVVPTLTPTIEDATDPTGTLVSDIIAQLDTSDYEGDPIGIAIVDTPSSNGTWQYYNTDTDTWNGMSGLSDNSAKLLAGSSMVRFIPDAEVSGLNTFQFRLWDGTEGTNLNLYDITSNGGSGADNAFSLDIISATVNIVGENDAPVITYSPTQTDYYEATDTSIASETVFNPTGFIIDDIDGDTLQSATIQITNVIIGEDNLVFTSQNGVDGTYDTATGILVLTDTGTSATNADFKAVIESIQYQNSSQDPDLTSRNIALTVNDGVLDSAPVSQNVDITPVNDQPLATGGSVNLDTQGEADVNPNGTLVSDIVSSLSGVSDLEGEPIGIAITSADNTLGDLEYSLDGMVWYNVDETTLSGNYALVLDPDDLVRFIPNDPDYNGAQATFQFHVWDGTGGYVAGQFVDVDSTYPGMDTTSPFGMDVSNAFHVISNVNDAPTIQLVDPFNGAAFDTVSGAKHIQGELATTVTDNFTLETWFAWDGTRTIDPQVLLQNGDGSTNGYGLSLEVVSAGFDKLVVDFHGVDRFNFDIGTLGTNVWNHFAAVRENGILKVYFNGVELEDFTTTSTNDDLTVAPITPSGDFTVGDGTDPLDPFTGKLDEIRVWETAQTEAEIQQNAEWAVPSDDTDLVLRYSFDEASSSVARDHALADEAAQNGIVYETSTGAIVHSPNTFDSPVGDGLHIDINDGESSEAGLWLDHIEFSDVDTSTDHTVTLTVTDGIWDYADPLPNGTINGNGTAVVTMTGPIGDINDYLVESLIRFLPTVRFEGHTNITVEITDGTSSSTQVLPVTVGVPDGGALINGTAGIDDIEGTFGNDVIFGGDGDDDISGGQGNDFIQGGDGVDNLFGGLGVDFVEYADDFSGITVDLLNGTVTASSGNDTLSAIEGVIAGAGDDTLTGSAADETFVGLAGADTIDGGDGTDTVSYYQDEDYDASTGGNGIVADLSAGTVTDASGSTDSVMNVENVYGTHYFDDITGDSQNNRFRGLDGVDTFDGGSGYDTIDYSMDYMFGGTYAITVNLSTGTATDGFQYIDTFVNIEKARGSQFADVFLGGSVHNSGFEQFAGLAGNDTFDGNGGLFVEVTYHLDTYYGGQGGIHATATGFSGDATSYTVTDTFGDTDTLTDIHRIRGTEFNDTVIGGDGRDRFRDTGGDDYFDGGAGTKDEIDYSAVTSAVNVSLESQIAYDDGEGGTDTLINVERVRGSDYDDIIRGDANSNFLRGGGGADLVSGKAGADYFYFDSVSDSYYVSAGDNAYDTITDFSDSEDKFLFEGMDGYEYDQVTYGDFTDVETFLLAVGNDASDKIYFFTVGGTDGYIYAKGAGTGAMDYSNALVELQGITAPVSITSFDSGVTAPNMPPTVLGVTSQPYAVDFDGVENQVIVGRGTGDNLEITGDLTVESWVKLDSVAANSVLLSFSGDGETADTNTVYEIYVDPTGDIHYKHEVGAGVNIDLTFDTNLLLGEWHHIALVREDNDLGQSDVTLYLDGAAHSTQNYDGANSGPGAAANAELSVGYSLGTAGHLDGSVADVRIWSEARSATDILGNYDRILSGPASETNLQAYWKFDQIDDQNEYVTDYSTGGNDIRVFDGLLFDGVDDKIVSAGSSTITDGHSMSAWINTETTTGGGIASADGGSQKIDFFLRPDGKLQVNLVGNTGFTKTYYATSTTVNDGAWHQIGYSYSIATGLLLYIDGAEVPPGNIVKTNDDAIASLDVTSEIIMGNSTGGSDYFDGQLAEVAVFDGAISAADFATLYTAGTDNVPALKLAHWEFDDGEGAVVANDTYNSAFGDGTVFGMTAGAETWVNATPSLNNYAQVHLALDGTNPIDLGTINPSSGDLSVSIWINPDDLFTSNQQLFSFGTEFVVELTSDGQVQLSLNNGTYTFATDYWGDAGEWKHITVTYNSSIGHTSIYFDGELANGGSIEEWDIAGVGYAASIGTNFIGEIGEVQLWTKELSAAEITSTFQGGLIGTETDLEGYWPMENGSGSTVTDLTGNHDGLLSTGATWQPSLPILVNDVVQVFEDQPLYSQIVADDFEGDMIGYALHTDGAKGTVVVNADGSFSYTPNQDETGSDSFIVTISDDQGNSFDHTFTVEIHDQNAEPNAVYDQYSTFEDTAIIITAADLMSNDTDQDSSDVLDVVAVYGPSNGTIVDNGNSTWTYTPDNGFTGMDSLSYLLSDGQGGTDTGHVDLDIQATNVELVNTSTAGDQTDAHVTALVDGGWVVTWTDDTQGTGDSVYAQRYNADGSKYGTEITVNTTDTTYDYEPNVVGLTDGGFVIAWSVGNGANSGGFFQRYNSDSTPFGAETKINTVSINYPSQPELTTLANGGFAVTYRLEGSGVANTNYSDVFLKTYDGSNNVVLTETVVNTTNFNQHQMRPDVATGSDGKIMVIWSDTDAGASPGPGIFGRSYDPSTTNWTTDFVIDATGSGDYASVASLSNGNYVVTWQQVNGADTDIYAKIVNSSGTVVQGAVFVNTTTTGIQQYSEVAVLHDGNFVVVWEGAGDDAGDPTKYGIYGQIMDQSGNKVGTEFLVNDNVADNQLTPHVVVLDDGSFVVTWTHDNGSETDVHQKRYNSDGSDYFDPNIYGTNASENLTGTAADETLIGYDGSDVLTGAGGNDKFLFYGSSDSNTTDIDYISDFDNSDDGIIFENGGHLSFHGYAGDYTTLAVAISAIDGSGGVNDSSIVNFSVNGTDYYVYVKALDSRDAYHDFLVQLPNGQTVSAANFELKGDGSAPVTGSYILGTANVDTLLGTAGDDTLDGLGGADELTGNGGSDTFFFVDNTETNTSDTDIITDFVSGDDKITIEGADGFQISLGYTFQGNVAATITDIVTNGTEDTVYTFTDGTSSYVYVLDTAGAYTDFLIKLSNNATLASADFNLTAAPTSHYATSTASETLTGSAAIVDQFVFDGAVDSANDGNYDIISNFNVSEDFFTLMNGGHLGFIGDNSNLGTLTAAITAIEGDNTGYPDESIVAFNDGTDTYLYAKVADAGDDYHNFLVKIAGLHSITVGNVYSGSSSLNTISGTAGDDTALVGTAVSEVIEGLAGNDTITGDTGNDTIIGGAGDDLINWNSSDGYDVIDATDDVNGLDVIKVTGGPYYDFNWGINGDDLLIGVTADDTYDFSTVGGNMILKDYFAGEDSVNYIRADVGTTNNAYYSATGSADGYSKIYLTSGITGTDQGNYTELLYGTEVADTLNGNGGYRDYIYGRGGDDILNGSDTTMDELRGGTGNDIMNGMSGDDRFVGGSGADVIDGGSGDDTMRYEKESGSQGVVINLSDSAYGGVGVNQATDTYGDTDSLTSIENARGSDYGDTFVGSAGTNTFQGYDGDDTFIGGAGQDTLEGGDGADVYVYSAATDSNSSAKDIIKDFDNTSDVIRLEGADGFSFVSNYTFNTDATTTISEILTNEANQSVVRFYDSTQDKTFVVVRDDGGSYNDYRLILLGDITLTAANFELGTPPGGDFIGTEIGDMLTGTSSDDYFEGQEGEDTLTGGGGSDVFSYSGAKDSNTTVTDTITDFDPLDDVIELVGGASYNTTFLNYDSNVADVMATIDAIELSESIPTGSVVSFDDGTETYLVVKAGGDAFAASTESFNSKFVIALSGVHTLTASNFNLMLAQTEITGTAAGETLTGGGTDDIISGLEGQDSMTGGTGNNTFVFYGANDSNSSIPNNITDFDPTKDEIILKGGNHLSFHGTHTTGSAVVSTILTEINTDGSIPDGSIVTFTQAGNTNIYVKTSDPFDPYNDFLLALNGGPQPVEDNFSLEYYGSEITGTSSDDVPLAGTHFDDTIFADEGDDTILGLGGNDLILAGDGTDTAQFEGTPDEYEISQLGSMVLVKDTVDTNGNEDEDILVSVEELYFNAEDTVANQRHYNISQATGQQVDGAFAIVWRPDVAGLKDGGYLISHVSEYAGSYEVILDKYFDDGSGDTSIGVVSTSETIDTARVIGLTGGGYAVAWVESSPSDGNDVWLKVYDSSGAEDSNFGGSSGINVGTASVASEQIDIRLAEMNDGGFVTAWTQDDNIVLKRYYADGTSSAETIVANTTNAEGGAEVIGLNNDGYAVIWQEVTSDNEPVKMSIYNAANTQVIGGIELDYSAMDDVHSRDITVLDNGNILITWSSDMNGDNRKDAVASIYSETGTHISGPFELNPEEHVGEVETSVTALNDGNFVAVWTAYGVDGDGSGIFGRIFDSSGNTVTETFIINDVVAGDQYSPQVDAVQNWDHGGGFVVTWESTDPNAPGLYKLDFNNDGTVTGGLTVTGTSGDDVIETGDGTQYLIGGAGDDHLIAGDGDDYLIAKGGLDTLDGGLGTDTASYKTATEAIDVDLAAGTVTSATQGTDTLISIENVRGSEYDDDLLGDSNDNFFNGGGGADVIKAYGGDDMILASAGGDVIDGGSGNDWMSFDDGSATTGISLDLTIAGNNVIGGSGDQAVSTDFGTMDIAAVENVRATSFDDYVIGDAEVNFLEGLEGDDYIAGGAGNDFLVGDDGADTLTGGDGMDILNGGEGFDKFRYLSETEFGDVIVDYDDNDKLVLHESLYSNSLVVGGDSSWQAESFEFIETGTDNGGSGDLGTGTGPVIEIYNAGDGSGSIYIDADGTGTGYSSTKIADVASGIDNIDDNNIWIESVVT